MVFKREWYLGFDTNDRIIAIIDKVPKGTKYKWKNPDLLYIGKEGLMILVSLVLRELLQILKFLLK